MYKQFMGLVLLVAFVAQMFSSMFIRLDYYLNTAAYLKNCENIARPKLKCGGKCQVMKKIKAEQKKEQEQSERKFENKTEVLSTKSFFCSIAYNSLAFTPKPFPIERKHILSDMSYSFFHPPKA